MTAHINLLHKIEPLERLRPVAARGELFAILDACDSPPVREKVKELGNKRAHSLYGGTAEGEHGDVAPYLVCADGPLLDWIHVTLWSEWWGILALAKASTEDLRSHFRRFIVVEKPDTEKTYFRFYDPRILRAFLPACTPDELNEFYGPIQAYGISHFEPDKVMLWRRGDS